MEMTEGTTQKLIFGAILIVVVAGIYLMGNSNATAGNSANQSKIDAFAKCLADKNVTMYGAFWCPHCQAEKAMFNTSWKYMNYVECSNPDYSETQKCQIDGISGYPTWQFGTQRVPGELTFAQIGQYSGCNSPQ